VLSLVKIHESESRRNTNQGGHDGKAEDMLSLHGSSRVQIRSWSRNKCHYELRVKQERDGGVTTVIIISLQVGDC